MCRTPSLNKESMLLTSASAMEKKTSGLSNMETYKSSIVVQPLTEILALVVYIQKCAPLYKPIINGCSRDRRSSHLIIEKLRLRTGI